MMRMNPLMQALDKNKDGEISAEGIVGAAAALKALDKNGDGKLTAEELRPAFGSDSTYAAAGIPGYGSGWLE
jgi:Ca2+-binding EF-hand superfamily protein